MDALAERVQTLGGVAIALAQDIEVVRRNELQSWFVGEHLASQGG